MKTHLRFLTALALVAGLWSALPLVAVAAPDDDDAASERDGYWQDTNRGWFFYERKPKKPPAPPPEPEVKVIAPAAAPVPSKPAEPPKHPDLVRFEALQKRVEETRNIAIINPTEENLRAFLTAQYEALDRAGKFGEAAQRVVWATPALDPSANGGRPTSASGMYMFDAEEERRLKRKWMELRGTHAFFYFYRGDCPYCKQFAPQLREFSERSGIEVMAIATDGAPNPIFPQARPDNGIAARLNVTQVPALFLAEPSTGKVLPVGYGVISPVDLERRVDLITQPQAEQVAPSTVQYIGQQRGLEQQRAPRF